MYREAASMLLIRPAPEANSQSFDILLLHKPRKKDAWQLPQGGIEEGETPEQCAVRELHEEAGITDVKVLGRSSTVYQYDFPASYRRFRPDHICGQRIYFILASAQQNAAVKVDGKEIDRHEWVKIDQLPKFLKRKEYLELAQHLYEEAVQAVKTDNGLTHT